MSDDHEEAEDLRINQPRQNDAVHRSSDAVHRQSDSDEEIDVVDDSSDSSDKG